MISVLFVVPSLYKTTFFLYEKSLTLKPAALGKGERLSWNFFNQVFYAYALRAVGLGPTADNDFELIASNDFGWKVIEPAILNVCRKFSSFTKIQPQNPDEADRHPS